MRSDTLNGCWQWIWTRAYSPAPTHLCPGHLDIRAPGCCASVHLAVGHLCICLLDVRAPGRWTSVHLVVVHPCAWPSLGGWTSLRLAVGPPCVWSLDIGATCRWTSVHSASVHLASGQLGIRASVCSTSASLGPWPLNIHAPGCCASVHLAAGQLGFCASGCWTSASWLARGFV